MQLRDNSYIGMPQGGIISPVLANIYLDKLAKYMKEYAAGFDRGNRVWAYREYEVLTSEGDVYMKNNRFVAAVLVPGFLFLLIFSIFPVVYELSLIHI